MDIERIRQFAIKSGFDDVEYVWNWQGYEVYNPVLDLEDGQEPPMIGLPHVILVRGDEIRWSIGDESLAHLHDQIAEKGDDWC